jgi:hypothetical protein
MRLTAPLETSPSRTGTPGAMPAERVTVAFFPFVATAGASTKVFQASHAGQRPCQRVDSCPHAEQKKAVRVFAIAVYC